MQNLAGDAGVTPAKKLRVENYKSEKLVIIQRFLRCET